MKTFSPKGKRPNLPLGWKDCRSYVDTAWYVYRRMASEFANKHNFSHWKAHCALQKKFPFKAPDTSDGYWCNDDFLLLFMWQFENWQLVTYDLDEIRQMPDYSMMPLATEYSSLDEILSLTGSCGWRKLVLDLFAHGHWHIIEKLIKDPIFGHEAKFELKSYEISMQFKKEEEVRKNALPAPLKKINDILETLGPSIYSIFYPYPKNDRHNIDNCLCVMADGSPIFRLEVLDLKSFDHFRLKEVMPPWWGLLNRALSKPNPEDGEYDFPFFDFGIYEEDEFCLETLMEVILKGKEQLSTRAERKWGKSNG